MAAVTTSPVIVDRWVARSSSRLNAMVRSAVLVVALAALTAACAQVSIPLPFTPVPLTLQTFAVLAGAGALGASRAVAAQMLYIAAAAVGMPVLAGAAGGAAKVLGATGGYLAGFIVASYVVGRIAQRGATTAVRSTVLAYAAGTAVVYVLGASWLAISTDMTALDAIKNGVVPFLIGDALKALAAGAVLPLAWRLTRD